MTETNRELTPAEIEKVQAETAKIRAETSRIAVEEAVQAERHRFEKAQAEIMILQADQSRRQEEMNLASDVYHHLYQFPYEVTGASVSSCMATLSYWHRTDPGCDIEIRFTSPGGSVVAGFVLFDYIQELKRQGHIITTSTLGMAASMAGILLQAGSPGRRIMGKEAWLVIHEGSLGVEGSAGEVEDMVKHMERVRERVVNIFVERAAISKAPKPITAAKLRAGMKRKDWYLTSDEALELGFVDEIS